LLDNTSTYAAVAAPAVSAAKLLATGAISRTGAHLLIVSTVATTIETFLVPYARHFRSLGWRVDAAAHGASESAVINASFDRVYEMPLSRSILDLKGMVRGRAAVSAALRSGPDVVHVHTPIAAFVTRHAASRMRAGQRPAMVYTAHGFHFHEGGARATNALFSRAERVAGRWTDRLVVINREDLAAAERLRLVRDGQLVAMPGIGVDTSYYDPSAVRDAEVALVRDELGIEADAPVFAVIGELSPRKRQRDAIAALAKMRRPNAHLVLAGELASETNRLRLLAQTLGLEARVHIVGYRDDVRPLVRAANAVILPSSREGLARSVMEALSLEVPVIVSAARGNRELVGDDAGIVCEIGDVDALARAMDRLLDHPEEGRRMGLRGRRRMIEGFDLSHLLRMHEALYEELLAQRG
jgi:glycosyltransferase involved in cell wall biosynthesis